ncbi:MAG TPA: transcriptional regulator MntR [Limnochordia bacterium]
MATPSMEDYLERIYELMQEKGYARVSDIASSLAVQPPSVTRMIQKLDEEEFVLYEKYRGIVLTQKGEDLGRAIKDRHLALEEFLRILGVQDEEVIQKDVEGIEHHVSPMTMACISKLVSFFQTNPAVLQAFERHRVAPEADDAAAGEKETRTAERRS